MECKSTSHKSRKTKTTKEKVTTHLLEQSFSSWAVFFSSYKPVSWGLRPLVCLRLWLVWHQCFGQWTTNLCQNIFPWLCWAGLSVLRSPPLAGKPVKLQVLSAQDFHSTAYFYGAENPAIYWITRRELCWSKGSWEGNMNHATSLKTLSVRTQKVKSQTDLPLTLFLP